MIHTTFQVSTERREINSSTLCPNWAETWCESNEECLKKHLGDEGEGARYAEVALDDLEVVVLGDQLHVEGASDVERVGDVAGDVADLGCSSVVS